MLLSPFVNRSPKHGQIKSIQNLSGQREGEGSYCHSATNIQAAELIHSFMPAGPFDWAFIIRTTLSPSVYESSPVQVPSTLLQLNLRVFIQLIATTPPSLFANKSFVPCWGFQRDGGLLQPLLSPSQICLSGTHWLHWVTALCHAASLCF